MLRAPMSRYPRTLQRDWYFIAEQPAPAPHLARPEGRAALTHKGPRTLHPQLLNPETLEPGTSSTAVHPYPSTPHTQAASAALATAEQTLFATVDLCLGTYGDPMGVGVSYERGTPAGGLGGAGLVLEGP